VAVWIGEREGKKGQLNRQKEGEGSDIGEGSELELREGEGTVG